VTLPVLILASGLKGSNLPGSGLSASAFSGFLSGASAGAGGAATDNELISARAASQQDPTLKRPIIVLTRTPVTPWTA
jgi:hypothetical protein